MSLKPYLAYKDSGQQWLGEVPEHWQIGPLGQHFTLRSESVSDKDFAPLSVTMSGIVPQMENVAKTENGDSRKLVRRGDFVINSRSDRKGSAGIADRDGSVSTISIVLVPRGIAPRFTHHLLRSVPFQEEFYRFGTGIVADLWSTRFSSMKSIRLALPAVHEQEAIADYLDRELLEISHFIADQEELIALLGERRAATVTQAVTKGLNPDAPMKGSCVAWLGEIPRSWTTKRLSWLFRTISSGTTPPNDKPEYYDGAFNWVTTGELRERGILETRRTITSEALSDLSALRVYPRGTLLIAMYGATIGRLGFLEAPATTNQACCAFADPIATNPRFMFYVLRAAREHLLVIADGGGQPNINQEKLRSLRVPYPTYDVQGEIVAYLDRETAEIDAAMADAHEAIALSKERRAAVISAAVTGKIDVRGASAPATLTVGAESVGVA